MQGEVSGRNMAFKCYQDYGFQCLPCVVLQASKGNSANPVKYNLKNLLPKYLRHGNYIFSLIHKTKGRYLLAVQHEEENNVNFLHWIKRCVCEWKVLHEQRWSACEGCKNYYPPMKKLMNKIPPSATKSENVTDLKLFSCKTQVKHCPLVSFLHILVSANELLKTN